MGDDGFCADALTAETNERGIDTAFHLHLIRS
jgi:hypothetical protein